MTPTAASRRTSLLLTLAACAALAGCAAHDDFVKAESAGTLQAWGDYVKLHPTKDHPNCDECKSGQKNYDAAFNKESQAFEAAKSAGTVRAYLDFLDVRTPQNPFYGEAVAMAKLHLLKGEATESDYEVYLDKYADPAASADVRRALMDFRLAAAKQAEGPGAAAYFIAQYAGTTEAARLSSHLSAKEFERAKKLKTRLALEFFLKRFPESAHAEQAQSLLAELPRAEPVQDDGSAGELLPKLRGASAALRGQECLNVLADSVRASGDPYGAAAEAVRSQFAAATDSADIAACRDAHMSVPAPSRALVSAAVRALVQISQRRARLGALFQAPDALNVKSRKIGKTAAQLAETAEAFDLEMQAYYGFMPADPDKPQEKASKDASEAGRRAQRAYELTQGGVIAARKKDAGEVIDLLNAQEDLLVKVIAYHEKTERRTP